MVDPKTILETWRKTRYRYVIHETMVSDTCPSGYRYKKYPVYLGTVYVKTFDTRLLASQYISDQAAEAVAQLFRNAQANLPKYQGTVYLIIESEYDGRNSWTKEVRRIVTSKDEATVFCRIKNNQRDEYWQPKWSVEEHQVEGNHFAQQPANLYVMRCGINSGRPVKG